MGHESKILLCYKKTNNNNIKREDARDETKSRKKEERERRKKGIHITTNKTMADTDKHDGAQIVHRTIWIQVECRLQTAPPPTLTPKPITWLLNFSGLAPFLVQMLLSFFTTLLPFFFILSHSNCTLHTVYMSTKKEEKKQYVQQ